MKRLFAAILCLCLLAGCGGKGSTGDTCGTKDDPAAGTEKVEPGGETGVEIGGCVPLVYHTEKTCDGDKENMESKKLDKSSKVYMSLASTRD